MPAASLWFVALGGLALGRPGRRATIRRATPPQIGAFVAGAAVLAASVFPALVLASQLRLNAATAAYRAGNCTDADRLAQRSIGVLATRAPPWQVEVLCYVRAGQLGRAEVALHSGLDVDPNDWQLQAALAAAMAAVGTDARAQAAVALRLNPQDAGVRALARALAGGPSARAREAAMTFLSQQSPIVTG